MNDVEGGGLLYWPDGPEKPPREHVGDMANTALVGDNHGMFHQVGPVGPFDKGTRLVTARAELAPASNRSGDWAILGRIEDPTHAAAISAIYPEAVPAGKRPSIFDPDRL